MRFALEATRSIFDVNADLPAIQNPRTVVVAGPREYHIGHNRRDFQGAFFITLLECDKDLV